MIDLCGNGRQIEDLPDAVPQNDRTVLRDLARQLAAIAEEPGHKETAELWRRLNDLDMQRPMIFIDEIPWQEFASEPEMALQCADETCRRIEGALRRTLYQWRHFPGDMVIDKAIGAPYVWDDSGYGIRWGECAVESGADRGARLYTASINTLDDVQKIQDPVIEADWDATEKLFDRLTALFADIVPVEPHGLEHEWFSPWDRLVTNYGITKLYTDMFDNPELVKAAVGRFVEASHRRLDQLEAEGLLSAVDRNRRIGSNGMGHTSELPKSGADPLHCRTVDQWGTATGQIFSEVSPAMHEEFCLQFERPYMERFGLSSYGCCEPLHNKVDMLRSVTNLRMISMSPFVDVAKGAEAVGTDYVYCYKPNPSYLAGERWNEDVVRQDLEDVIAKTRGCHLSLILKDIHTVRNEPRRLAEWNRVAREIVLDY